MRAVTLQREPGTDAGTFGTLTLKDGLTLRTVELPWRGNATGRSCIPPGTYRCEIVNSPRFGKVYGVRDVAGRQNILLHAANFGGDVDKGFQSDLLGCIAPATDIKTLTNKWGNPQKAGVNSAQALGQLMKWGNGLPFDLLIVAA